MGLFGSSFKISEGEKYDVNSVSTDGVSKEEATKNKIKLKKLFDAFDLNKNGTLSEIELAKAMDAFESIAGEDKKISSKEFEEAAKAYNDSNLLRGKDAISGKELKKFFKNIMKASKGDNMKTREVVYEEAARAEEAQRIASQVVDLEEVEEEITEEEKPQPVIEKKPETYSYTVQNGDSFTGLIKRILKEQGNENPSAEDIEAAKKIFIEQTPKAVHKNSRGVEYLLVGAKVRTGADLGDKNNANEQIGAYSDAVRAADDRKKTIARNKAITFTNKDYNTFEELAKALFEKEGITPTKKELAARVKELKEQNKDLVDGELKGKKITAGVVDSMYNRVAKKEEEVKETQERAQYTKTRSEAGKIAKELFDICDNNPGGVGMKSFKDAMNKIKPENVVEVLNKYDEQKALHQGDTSLMDTICSEYGTIVKKQEHLTHIIDTLAEEAKNAGVSDDDIKAAKDAYMNSMKEQFKSIHRVNTKDMEKAVDFLRGAIEAKRQGKGAEELSTQDAMKQFATENRETDENIQNVYSDARKEEGWAAKTGDWVCGLFGCNTIDDMNKKLGANADGAKKLAAAAQSGDEAEFKKVYKEVFGIEFDAKKIAARNSAQTRLDAAQSYSSTVKISDEILKKSDADYATFREEIKQKFGLDDETVDSVINSYKENAGMKADSDEDKKAILLKFIQETKSESKKEFDKASKGRSLDQMERDLELLTKSAYGTNDIVKDVIQFNENQQTTEMVTIAAAEIAGTVALQFVPGLGQMAAAKLAVSAARWGARGAKFANYASKAAKGFATLKKAETATKTGRVVTGVANAGVATATVNALDGKNAEEVIKKTLMNMSFAGVGAGSSLLAPKIAQQFGISSKLAKEIVEEALNSAGAAGIVVGMGGEYGTNEALTDFVTGMIIARLSHVKTDTPTGGTKKNTPALPSNEGPAGARQIEGAAAGERRAVPPKRENGVYAADGSS